MNFYHVTDDVGGKSRRLALSECAHAVWGRVAWRRVSEGLRWGGKGEDSRGGLGWISLGSCWKFIRDISRVVDVHEKS